MTTRTNLWQDLDYAHLRVLVGNSEPPVDDTGHDYSRFIPEDRVEGGEDGPMGCTHPDETPDHVDGVMRCRECDEPLYRLPHHFYN